MAIGKKILIAVSASQGSHRAVSYVADMLRGNSGCHVGLVHLKLPPRMLEWGGTEDPLIEDKVSAERASDYGEMEKEAIDEGTAMLQGFRQRLTESGIDVTALMVQLDEPLDPQKIAREILNTARQGGYGTVVVGRNSFSGLKHFFQHHHVAEDLVRAGEEISIWVVE
jgi:nucleotide-binding universal stress UspA family protein